MKPMGPYTVWVDFGYEGWQPTDYKTLNEAVQHQTYGSPHVITKPVNYSVEELDIHEQRDFFTG